MGRISQVSQAAYGLDCFCSIMETSRLYHTAMVISCFESKKIFIEVQSLCSTLYQQENGFDVIKMRFAFSRTYDESVRIQQCVLPHDQGQYSVYSS